MFATSNATDSENCLRGKLHSVVPVKSMKLREKMINKWLLHLAGFLVLSVVMLPSISFAQVFKCQDSAGKVAYQNLPCAAEQKESRPVILKAPTLTDAEKFNAEAYSAGTTPKEARRRLQGGSTNPEQSAANTGRAEAERQEQQRVRAAECDRRYDKLAAEIRRSGVSVGRLNSQLLDVERGRTSCVSGTAPSSTRQGRNNENDSNPPSPNIPPQVDRGAQMGQCHGSCGAEQGMCMGQCQGNAICTGRCADSQARCTAACSRMF